MDMSVTVFLSSFILTNPVNTFWSFRMNGVLGMLRLAGDRLNLGRQTVSVPSAVEN